MTAESTRLVKCLIINGSSSGTYMWNGVMTQSFTGKLVKEVQNAMSGLGRVDFEEIRLADVGLPYCRGCYNCFFKGEDMCPHAKLIQREIPGPPTTDTGRRAAL